MSKTTHNSNLELSSNPKITLNCEIIEIFENEGKSIAKIKFNPGIMKLVIDPAKQYHLGDEVCLTGRIKIESILQNISDAL